MARFDAERRSQLNPIQDNHLEERFAMKSRLGLIAFAVILSVGIAIAGLTYAASEMAAAPGPQIVKGDLLKMEGEF
jgi:hypothetical protein